MLAQLQEMVSRSIARPAATLTVNGPRERAKQIIREHYRLTRPVTDEELDAELSNLRRRSDEMSLDDFSGSLAARLGI